MAQRSAITTHVLDTAAGQPAAGVPITLELKTGDTWTELGRGETDDDGRLGTLAPPNPIATGIYRITFSLTPYFDRQKTASFYPHAQVVFEVRDGAQHFHVPLLLSPFGYSTYRGS